MPIFTLLLASIHPHTVIILRSPCLLAETLNPAFLLQTLTANIVALVWNVYMSFQSHKAVEVKSAA